LVDKGLGVKVCLGGVSFGVGVGWGAYGEWNHFDPVIGESSDGEAEVVGFGHGDGVAADPLGLSWGGLWFLLKYK
jgi:hypothetical protein